jgi:hypothetical protein
MPLLTLLVRVAVDVRNVCVLHPRMGSGRREHRVGRRTVGLYGQVDRPKEA